MSIPEGPTGQPPQLGSADEKTWAMTCHLAALVGLVFPLGNVIGPLIVWLVKKDEMPMVNEHGKESLNFQFTVVIAVIAIGIVETVFLVFTLIRYMLASLCCLAASLVGIYAIVMVIMAAIKAKEGVSYRYPIALRLIS